MYYYNMVVYCTMAGLNNAIGKMQVNTYNKSNASVTFVQMIMDSF